MGQLIRVQCNRCGSAWQLHQGNGLVHGRADTVAALFPETVRQTLPLEAMRRMDEPWEFSLEPAVCPTCHALVDIPTIRFPGRGDTVVGSCPTCGSPAERIPVERLGLSPCPACGERTLEAVDSGLWD